MDYANMVMPEEMDEGRRFLAGMLDVLCARDQQAYVPAEVICVSQGWGDLQDGCSCNGEPLVLGGRPFATGLGTHACSEIIVRLPDDARRLTGWGGINQSPMTSRYSNPAWFSVEVNGRTVWQSGEQRVSDAPARVDVTLADCREFTLRVLAADVNYVHAIWADMQVEMTNGRIAVVGGAARLNPGFSFTYDGVPSSCLLRGWELKKQRLAVEDGVVLHRVTRTDPKTGLAVICELKEYTRYPVVEWWVRFKNTSKKATPILEDIRSMDTVCNLGQFPYLNHWTGDYCSPDGYEPFRVSLAHGEEYRFAPMGGRPTNRAFPYYNLEAPVDQRGLIVVVGWVGQWAAKFSARDGQNIRITAGQERTHFTLLPGEEARTPLSVLMFYRGDRARSRNLWRRWFLDHNIPRPGGKPLKPYLTCCSTDDGDEYTEATEENQVRAIDRFKERGIHPDIWWIDAGWYPCRDANGVGSCVLTGTWELDPERFPRGLKPVSDRATKAGADLLLWFEPERVREGSWLDTEHPEWVLRNGTDVNRLLNLGDPKCRRWLTNHVCRLIRENGVKVYRQDFGFDPLPYWQRNEAADRQGMNENLHVQGYYRYWKDLLARNPGLWIDSCASGGRRNDLETMRLAVPLHYTDYGYGDHVAKQSFHAALCEWFPYFKEFTLSSDLRGNSRWEHEVDRFAYHCAVAPMLMLMLDSRRDDYDFALASKMIGVWRKVAGMMLEGDYYPLTPYHRSADQWVARQFDRPEEGRGFIQGIRMPAAPAETLTVYPQGLEAEANYHFENPETGEIRDMTGATLQGQGFCFALPKRAGAIWLYQRLDMRSNKAHA